MKHNETSTIISNRFVVGMGQCVRIAFGEQVDQMGDTNYHTAVLLQKSDAKELAAIITRLLSEQESKGDANENPANANA